MTAVTYLGLGANLGDRSANLRRAVQSLGPEVVLKVSSSVYETPPWGYADQPAFLNQVVQAETQLPPMELLDHLKRLEASLGRQVTFQYGPRLIDLDILLYDQLALDEPGLVIPHPRLAERAFVLVPLSEIAPNLRHPLTGRTVTEMLAALDVSGIRRIGVE